MVLKDYYKNLPERTSPKWDFLSTAASRCGVSTTTVRNWCKYGMKPRRYSHVKILCEMTGLSEDELWDD